LRILIEAGGEAVEAKIRGKVAILKFLPVRVDMGLQEGNGIRKLGRLDSAEKEPTAGSIIVVVTKTAITVTVDIDSTTEERFANGGLSVPIGGLGGGRQMRCDMPARCGARRWSSGAAIVCLVGCPTG
jgi:hypothetical protein